jgi:hypothetical protein
MKAERRRLDEVLEKQRGRVAELEEELKDEIHRVHMLRALREDLPPADAKDLPEPP